MTGTAIRLLLLALCLGLVGVAAPGCGSEKQNTGSLPYLGEKGGIGADTGQGTGGAVILTGEKTDIVLYFGDKDGALAAEKRTIPRTQGIARATLQELIQGPSAGSGLAPTLPPGTSLNSIKIQDGTATADFSQELKSGHKGGSTGEMLTVYSIVNTLTQFPTIQKVQILVDGQKLETLAGHLDLSKPLERDGNIIRPNAGNNLKP